MGDTTDGGSSSKNNNYLRLKNEKNDETDNSNLRSMEEVIAATQISEENYYYRMDHNHRGYALVFNHIKFQNNSPRERIGTENDVKRILTICNNLGFKLKAFTDYKFNDIKASIKSLSKKIFKNCDCALIWIMTHGFKNDMIHAYDRPYAPSELWRILKDIGKPVLFFINACRGLRTDDGVVIPQEEILNSNPLNFEVSVPIEKLPTEDYHSYFYEPQEHLLVMWASTPDHVAFKRADGSAVFIEALCSKLEEFQYTEDLTTILAFVNQDMAMNYSSSTDKTETNEKRQVGVVYSYLLKRFRFVERMSLFNR